MKSNTPAMQLTAAKRSGKKSSKSELKESSTPNVHPGWDDPRLDERLKPIMQFFATQRGTRTRTLEECTKDWAGLVESANRRPEQLKAMEAVNMMDHEHYLALAPQSAAITTEGSFESSFGGNTVRYSFLRPSSAPPGAQLPCIYYTHGGGMMSGSAFYTHYQAWGRMMALHGLCVFFVDFRNSLVPGLVDADGSTGEVAEYPGGLNDCVSGVRYLHKNAASFGVCPDKIFLAGESGGGNLCLATAMRLNADGDIDIIRGIYALCPYVLGNYPDPSYRSTVENNGIFLLLDGMGAHFYGIDSYKTRDPCAWPIFAQDSDLAGLPPTMISCNECDPLLDEGIAMYRKLRDAGVETQARIVVGTCHAAEILFLMPEVTRGTINNLAFFVHETIASTAKPMSKL